MEHYEPQMKKNLTQKRNNKELWLNMLIFIIILCLTFVLTFFFLDNSIPPSEIQKTITQADLRDVKFSPFSKHLTLNNLNDIYIIYITNKLTPTTKTSQNPKLSRNKSNT